MIRFVTYICTQTIFVWVLTAGLSLAQEKAPAEAGWGVTCLTDRVCELKTEIVSGATVAARVSIIHVRGEFWLQYTIPLGVDLRRGIQLSIDDGESFETTITSCTAYGCTGRLDLTPEIIESMQQGNILRIFFVRPSVQRVFLIPFSLVGFTAGFVGLTEQL
ncbi:invasion associated locus B family protein [Aliiroseovarius crassostreae]|uniref:invasion associated locus B family protein n=1 Tax=Aliiroseovarius crassostreae TaxID=154981 RepID=UPI001587D9B3|nr:invasion associated locus B family protein [Aliiroseovarius crassostreae]